MVIEAVPQLLLALKILLLFGFKALFSFLFLPIWDCWTVSIMGIKAIYEKEVLKPIGKLDLKEGEEVEIDVKKRRIFGEKGDILRYAGILEDLGEEEEKTFQEAVKRRSLFGRALKL